MKSILMPLPLSDFDPSETAIPWKVLTEKGYRIIFATPNGEQGSADNRMLTGEGLGLLKKMLMAAPNALQAYSIMSKSPEFQKPISYKDIRTSNYDAVIFPGGHAKGMCPFLEDTLLQNVAIDFFKQEKVVAAVCHGVLILARAKNPSTGKSLLYGKKTTALTSKQENLAVMLTKHRLGDYYRTYLGTTVQQEVCENLEQTSDFIEGPLPILRDDANHLGRGYAHVDGKYISARWPGDLFNFCHKIDKALQKQ